jgi:hypothetical protein
VAMRLTDSALPRGSTADVSTPEAALCRVSKRLKNVESPITIGCGECSASTLYSCVRSSIGIA